MKVVQINSSCEYGSTGRITVEISKKLDEKQIENYIFYSGNRRSDFKNGIQINKKTSIRVHQVLSRVFGDQGWHSYFTTKKLVLKLKKISPDIIHLHNIHGYYLHMDVLFKYLAKSNAKVIFTLHDCWAFTGHCTHFTQAKCKKWLTLCHNCPQKTQYPYSLFFDRSKTLFKRKQKLYDAIENMTVTAVSLWLKKTAKQSKLLSKKEVCVIPNGIDIQKFLPKKPLDKINGTDVTGKHIVLGVANYWSERKGLNDFKQLAKKLSHEFIVVIVGIKKEQQIDMPKNIICLERTDSQEELAQIYSSALVFFNASIEETFGLTTVEAMACGTPVITYKSTACSDVVTKETGFALTSNDVDGVLQAIMKIKINGKEAYASACREHAKEYDSQRIYDEYINLYLKKTEEK